MIEIFKDIPDYEGFYQVSNLGRVKKINRYKYSSCPFKFKKLRIKNGYFEIQLNKKMEAKFFTIHRLVMLTFIGKCPEGLQVNHIDGNKQNNRLDNLEYISAKENTIHAWKIGLCKGKRFKGKNSGNKN